MGTLLYMDIHNVLPLPPVKEIWCPTCLIQIDFILRKAFLRRAQAEPGRTVKLQQEQNSPNLERIIKEISVQGGPSGCGKLIVDLVPALLAASGPLL